MDPVEPMGPLLKAIHFAAQKHTRQRRKNSDASPYINHPLAVIDILGNIGQIQDVGILTAAVLHDTLEDTDATYETLTRLFGPRIADLVQEVSDDKSLPKMVRKQRQIEQAPAKSDAAKCIKLADFISNISDLKNFPPARWSASRREAYLVWCRAVAAGLRGVNTPLEERFDDMWHASWQTIMARKRQQATSAPPS